MAMKNQRKHHNKVTNKEHQVSVRFGSNILEELDHIDTYVRVGRAELIRRAVEDFLVEVGKNKRVTISAEIPPRDG